MNHDKWFAVVNPSSANGKTKDKWPKYYQSIKDSGLDLNYEFTAGAGKGTELTRQAINAGYTKIIAVGGDGTVNEVINGLMHEDKPLLENIQLAILEHGTGGDFVRSYKSKSQLDEFITSLLKNETIQIDVGKVTFKNLTGHSDSRYFINASNLGIGAEAVYRVNNRSKVLGSKITYFMGTLGAISSYQNIMIAFQCDEKPVITGKYCGLIVCNGRYMGGGMQVAPEAKLDDGLFDLIVIKDITKLTLLKRFPSIYYGKHIHLPEIEVHRCQNLKLKTTTLIPLETDGEIIGFSPQEFQVLPKCLTLTI